MIVRDRHGCERAGARSVAAKMRAAQAVMGSNNRLSMVSSSAKTLPFPLDERLRGDLSTEKGGLMVPWGHRDRLY